MIAISWYRWNYSLWGVSGFVVSGGGAVKQLDGASVRGGASGVEVTGT
ncbi:MAG: hypothetical protein V7K57_22825 [Nostoc sp.]